MLTFSQLSELSFMVLLAGKLWEQRWRLGGQFEVFFLSAFLSEDYEDELAERIRTCRQKENQSIRDFAFSHRALCKRWTASRTEDNIVKMILYQTISGKTSPTSVEELVCLSHQFEKDHYKKWNITRKWQPKMSIHYKNFASAQLNENPKPSVLCWRCKGDNVPGWCPRYSLSCTNATSHQQQAPP